jgi:ABC-type methionine transport system ATPase subunit
MRCSSKHQQAAATKESKNKKTRGDAEERRLCHFAGCENKARIIITKVKYHRLPHHGISCRPPILSSAIQYCTVQYSVITARVRHTGEERGGEQYISNHAAAHSNNHQQQYTVVGSYRYQLPAAPGSFFPLLHLEISDLSTIW